MIICFYYYYYLFIVLTAFLLAVSDNWTDKTWTTRPAKVLLRQVHSTLLASLVFISKEGSLSQVSLGLRAKALG